MTIGRILIALACSMTVTAAVHASPNSPTGLESLRGMHRILLVYAVEPQRSRALVNLADFSAGIEERDIVWFVIGDGAIDTNRADVDLDGLRESLPRPDVTPSPGRAEVILIGKDGTVKSRSSDLDLEATFGLIDTMPMRRAEMRRRDGG